MPDESKSHIKNKRKIDRLFKARFIRTTRYVEWISNIVLVIKINGKLRVCIDFKSINVATAKDEYPIPVVDLLVDIFSSHVIMSIMDVHSRYNQICIIEEDVFKTS